MTSRRDRHDDEGFAWPPTQDDLDALNVLALDERPGVAAEYRRVIRERRHGHDNRTADAPRRILPERSPVLASNTTRIGVPPPATPARRRGLRTFPLDRLALLASGMVIGLALAAVAGLRPPSTTTGDHGSPSLPPAAGGSAGPAHATAPLPGVQLDRAVAVPTGGTIPGATSSAIRPTTTAVSRRTTSAPRVTSSRVTRATAAHETTAPEPASEGVAPEGSSDGILDGVADAVPDAASESTPADAAPAALTSARPSIVEVLLRYQAAYSRMDVWAARAVWPSVDARALERGFGTLQEQELVLGACEITVVQDRATAECPGTLRYRPRVGNTAPQRRNGRWEVRLARGAGGWAITSVNAR